MYVYDILLALFNEGIFVNTETFFAIDFVEIFREGTPSQSFTDSQLRELWASYKSNRYLTIAAAGKLAEKLNLSLGTVTHWFCGKYARKYKKAHESGQCKSVVLTNIFEANIMYY